MNDTSASGDIATAPAVTGSSPEPATSASQVDTATGATSGQPDPQGSLTTDATAFGPDQPGWAPGAYARFKEVNEQYKQATEWRQNLEQSWGEILKADPSRLREMIGWYQRAAADPVAHATQLLSELQADERYRPQVASQAAKILSALRVQQPKEDPEPQPDLVAENGLPVYSAKQQRDWLGWNQRKMQAEFDAKLQQTVAPFKSLVQRQQQVELEQQTKAQADAQLQRARQWHGFKEHESEIAKVFDAHPEFDLKDAYLHVLHEKILPTLPAKAQAAVVADLQSKAAAQTLNPSGATRPATPDFKGDFKAALEHAAKNAR